MSADDAEGPQDLLDEVEAAEVLGVEVEQVRVLADDGLLVADDGADGSGTSGPAARRFTRAAVLAVKHVGA